MGTPGTTLRAAPTGGELRGGGYSGTLRQEENHRLRELLAEYTSELQPSYPPKCLPHGLQCAIARAAAAPRGARGAVCVCSCRTVVSDETSGGSGERLRVL